MRILRSWLAPTLLILVALGTVPGTARAVPPVPNKQGSAGPKEGFSTERLGADFALLPGRGERITVETQAIYKVLAIRIAFSDTPIESTSAYYDRLLFFMGQYWNQVSGGNVTLQPTLWDSVFTVPVPMSYYGDDAHFQERLVILARDLVTLADSTVDFRGYQSIVIFHAGAGQEADVFDNSREQIWSAFLTPQDFKTVLPDSTGAVGIKTNDEITPGHYYYLKEAVVLPEVESQDGYEFGMMGVCCHEFGHQLGLPDLYDTTGDLNGSCQGLGSWDIMATGVWNANGYVPAEPSAWSKSYLRWIVPARATTDQSVTLSQVERAVGAYPRIVQVPVTQSEYFLIENRRQDLNGDSQFTFQDVNGDQSFDFYTDSYAGAEFDYFLPGEGTGSGVLAYHVDESKIAAGLLNNVVNGDRDRKAVDLEEADGVQDLDDPPSGLNSGSADDVFRAGWRNRWTPDTSPSTEAYGHIRTGISVENISAPESLMTFDISFDRNRPGWPVTIGGRSKNAGMPPLAVDLNGDGKLELIVPVRLLTNKGAVYVLNEDGTDFLDRDSNPATRDTLFTTTSWVAASPCVGDIDGDGKLDIVVQTVNETTYAMHADGTEVLDGDQNPATRGVFAPGGAVTGGAQPILADLNGDGSMEVIAGRPANAFTGGSFLNVYQVVANSVVRFSIPMGGSTALPAAAADLDDPPDGRPEIIVANVATVFGDFAASGLSIVNWEILNDPLLPIDAEQFTAYMIGGFGGTNLSAPILVDLNGDAVPEVVAADQDGRLHALRVTIGPHGAGEWPLNYTTATELPGWPTAASGPARLSEVSLGDLEHDGYPEVFHTGAGCRVAGVHYSGSPRSGYPIAAGDSLAPADSAGYWPPIVADVDGDGFLDVIPILPDGSRPAYRGNGQRIREFGELGSTGQGAPPILADLDGDGRMEWVEVFDQVSSDPRVQITVHNTSISSSPGATAWTQYRNGPTRDGYFPTAPAEPGSGTSVLSEVYGYPNPSRSGSTQIHYHLGAPARAVHLRIVDPAGNTVMEVPTGGVDLLGSAEHVVTWNHASLASGVYLCRVEVESDLGTEVKFTKLAVVR